MPVNSAARSMAGSSPVTKSRSISTIANLDLPSDSAKAVTRKPTGSLPSEKMCDWEPQFICPMPTRGVIAIRLAQNCELEKSFLTLAK